jgi:hypothetical protein
LCQLSTDRDPAGFFGFLQMKRSTNNQPAITPPIIAPFERITGQFNQYMSVFQLIGFTKKIATPNHKMPSTAAAETINFGNIFAVNSKQE